MISFYTLHDWIRAKRVDRVRSRPGQCSGARDPSMIDYERFAAPGHPRILPADLVERARARQVMSMLRTSLFALREDRPTSTVFGRPNPRPLSDHARDDAAELERLALAVLPDDRPAMFGAWCIADIDLALALMRLIANGDPLDRRLTTYALAQFERKSVHRFVSHLPTTR